MTTDQLKGSAEYAQFLANVQKGIYGAELKQKMSNIFGRLKPNSSSVVKGMNYSYENFNSSFKSMARKTGIGALFFLPFIGAFFSENTRKFFAEEAVKDMTNGINVVSENPLGRDS